MLSPVFKALKEDEECSSRSSQSGCQEVLQTGGAPSSCHEDILISPSKCRMRRPVRNLNNEFVKTPSKEGNEAKSHENNKIKFSQVCDNNEVDVFAAFGQYVAAEMRRLESDRSVRLLKQKIMKAILEVQSEQDQEV